MSRRALLLAGGLATMGCASAQPSAPIPPATRPPTCLITSDSAGPARAITAVFDDPIDAERARLAADRLAPVRLDCEGRPAPGLARRWSRDTTGRFWTVELDSASSAPGDGGPRWTAGALAATWRADPEAARTLRDAGVESVLPLDDRRLVIAFRIAAPDLPRVLAARVLGVTRGGPSTLLGSAPVSGDLRDAVDRGTDLIESGNPDLLDYASRRPGVTIAALPWSRIYFLVVPEAGAGVDGVIPADTAAFRAALARDAVRTEARAAEARAWPDSAARCPRAAVRRMRPPPDVIAYLAADSAARELAERIVALATPTPALRPLGPDSLMAALGSGDARAIIVSGPSRSAVPCADAPDWPAGSSVIPLVETRRHAIVRRGAPMLVAEWDGALRVAEPGDTGQLTP